MAYHKLLQRQLKKYVNSELVADGRFLQFIEAVNGSYVAFERDKELSDHAFAISQDEFSEINGRLKGEVELRKLSIKRLKSSLHEIKNESKVPFDDDDGGLLEIVDLLNAEMATRKEAERQLLIAKEEAEKASMVKSEFLSVMSHEIRTPLNAVIGMGHLLLKNHPRADQLGNLMALKTSSDNLLVLINDILDFNKIEAGKLDLEEKPFCIKKLVTDIITANTNAANKRGNRILFELDDKLPSCFLGDSTRLGQVLNNLVSNAVKFTHKGCITVKTHLLEAKPGAAVINFSIEDTGVGISKESLETIFLPFTQASTSITRKYGGTGLGLAITRRILGLLDSEIEVESILGTGSKFFFTLQLATIDCSHQHTVTIGEEHFDLKNKNILLVEDTPFNVLYATQLLEDWNATVAVAENGEVAVSMLNSGNFDLVLMDLQMPVMDGYTATVKLREFDTKTPVIALTASATGNVREKVISAGMQDYIAKPFNPDDLLIKLKKYLS